MGHNCVAAILTLLQGSQALVILAGALAGNRPETQLYLMCLLELPDASIVHLSFTSDSQISSLSLYPSASGATPRCGKEIPLYSVLIITVQASCMRIEPGSQGPGGIRNTPVLPGCKLQPPPCHRHPLKMCLEEFPRSVFPGSALHTVRAVMLLRRKG